MFYINCILILGILSVNMHEDLYARGSKRRLSDVDDNERLTQRQTVLNMSICKLQKDYGRKEPPLLRQILISNTVHKIEQEMDEESQMNLLKNEELYPIYGKLIEADFRDWTKREAMALVDESKNPEEIRASFADIGTDISSNSKNKDGSCDGLTVDDEPNREPNKFGAIGDHRKQNQSQCTRKQIVKQNGYQSLGFDLKIWEDSNQLHLPMISLPPANENITDIETFFHDIDISLYDFDFMAWSPQMHDWKQSTDQPLLTWPSLSCGAEAEKKKGDSFFDDLDQIMQVLVGM